MCYSFHSSSPDNQIIVFFLLRIILTTCIDVIVVSQLNKGIGRSRGRGRGQHRCDGESQFTTFELVAPYAKQFIPSITKNSQWKKLLSCVLMHNCFGGPLDDIVATDVAFGIGSKEIEEESSPLGMIKLCVESRL